MAYKINKSLNIIGAAITLQTFFLTNSNDYQTIKKSS